MGEDEGLHVHGASQVTAQCNPKQAAPGTHGKKLGSVCVPLQAHTATWQASKPCKSCSFEVVGWLGLWQMLHPCPHLCCLCSLCIDGSPTF